MRVADLIEVLKKCDPNAVILTFPDESTNGYGYAQIDVVESKARKERTGEYDPFNPKYDTGNENLFNVKTVEIR